MSVAGLLADPEVTACYVGLPHALLAPTVEAAATAVGAIYKRNIFPEMKVTWGTYPNNIGHRDFPGCFRCHDANHVTRDGKEISQDCAACHAVLAMEETDPKVLKDLGLK